MSDRDAAELDWWRSSFSCRFQANNLPKPGTPLLGIRYVLMYDDPDASELIRWENT